jgi:hypothetical protein
MRLDAPHRHDCPEGDAEAALLAAVLAALRGSGYRPLWQLHCEVIGSVVAVSGVVPSYHLKQVTQTAILRLPQVREVRNLVEVRRHLGDNGR